MTKDAFRELWLKEAQQRREEVRLGKVKTVSAATAKEQIREILFPANPSRHTNL